MYSFQTSKQHILPLFLYITILTSIRSLHNAFLKNYGNYRILEISSNSENNLGVSLSVFHLQITLKNGKKVPVEYAFQAGKIFEKGGPFSDTAFNHQKSINCKQKPLLFMLH